MALHSQSLSKELVLIVGCGDIGSRFAEHLSQSDYEAIGLRRNPPTHLPYLQYQACDATDPTQLAQVLTQDFSIILVSMTPSERSDAGYQQAYVQTCQNLVDGLRAQSLQPRLIMFISSTAVYAQMDGSWVDENSPAEPDSFSGKRLLEAENIIANSGFPSTILRFSGIYGQNRNRLIEQVRQKCASNSLYFTNRIHADDGARFMAHLASLQLAGLQKIAPLYLVSDSKPAPMLEVVAWLANQLGVKDFLSTHAANERGNKRCSNRLLLATGFEFHYPNYQVGYSALLNAIKPPKI